MALAHPVDSGEPIEHVVGPVRQRVTVPTAATAVVVAEGPTWHAFQLLHWAFVVLPIVAGANKFFQTLGPWQTSVAPLFSDLLGVSVRSISYTVGAAEGVMGIIVAFSPRIGGWLMAAWLWGIVVTQLIGPGYVDVALRDAALSLGALALARLAVQFDHAINPPVQRSRPEPIAQTVPSPRIAERSERAA